MNIKNLLWEEKYRPNLNEIILPKRLKDYFKKIIESKRNREKKGSYSIILRGP